MLDVKIKVDWTEHVWILKKLKAQTHRNSWKSGQPHCSFLSEAVGGDHIARVALRGRKQMFS